MKTPVLPLPKKPTAAEIDEFGEVRRQIKLLESSVPYQREKVLKSLILDAARSSPADQPVEYKGSLYSVVVSPAEQERKLTLAAKKKIFAALKRGGLDPLSLFSVTLENVKVHLGESYLDSLVEKERTGSRKPTEVLMAAVEKKAA